MSRGRFDRQRQPNRNQFVKTSLDREAVYLEKIHFKPEDMLGSASQIKRGPSAGCRDWKLAGDWR